MTGYLIESGVRTRTRKAHGRVLVHWREHVPPCVSIADLATAGSVMAPKLVLPRWRSDVRIAMGAYGGERWRGKGFTELRPPATCHATSGHQASHARHVPRGVSYHIPPSTP
jgi:hypothetical protein